MAALLTTKRCLRSVTAIHASTRPINTGGLSKLTSARSFLTTTQSTSSIPNFAFAFDIDGVLLRSSTPLPGATSSLRYLQAHRIPFILLTNGGGKSEAQRVADLSRHLDVPLDVDMFVQSHTPFAQLVEGTETLPRLKDENILVLGGEGNECRDVAEGPPNRPPNPLALRQPYPLHPPRAPPPPSPLRIAAILIFHDPRDWALDIQIVIDLLLSRAGVLGTRSPKAGDPRYPNWGWQTDGQPELYFSNPDLWWASAHALPRLGQGGFQHALCGVYDAVVGNKRPEKGWEFRRRVFGKPSCETFAFAEGRLEGHRRALLGLGGGEARLRRVFMVGDNPASDICGANRYRSPVGTGWESILVRTGVYKEGKPDYEPKAIVPDVTAAVRWALEKSGWEKPFP
ncbi:hypothetical protein G7Y79_00008g023000 [Physcia stellaris]|nr:hypothetical protein G7Y79_00008g023000 [Physcia stellaris]